MPSLLDNIIMLQIGLRNAPHQTRHIEKVKVESIGGSWRGLWKLVVRNYNKYCTHGIWRGVEPYALCTSPGQSFCKRVDGHLDMQLSYRGLSITHTQFYVSLNQGSFIRGTHLPALLWIRTTVNFDYILLKAYKPNHESSRWVYSHTQSCGYVKIICAYYCSALLTTWVSLIRFVTMVTVRGVVSSR